MAWWDTSLLPANDLREDIERKFSEAKAIIVIWTPECVGSRWVHSAAEHGDRDGKLINTRTPDFHPRRIPRSFNQTDAIELGGARRSLRR